MSKAPKNNIKFDITLSDEQKEAKEQVLTHAYSFLVGRAGSGKTLLACQIALDMVFKKQYNEIIITRPTVSTEDIGFLPGSEQEKMEPWLVPIVSNMKKIYGGNRANSKTNKLDKMMKEKQIEVISLAHFRGRTYDNAVVIVDEFQNLTKAQLQMALGRLGKNSIMIFCGDAHQVDLRDKNISAVHDVAKLEASKHVYKTILKDNHRHAAVKDVLKLLSDY